MRPSFYDIEDFPKLKKLADQWEVIRDEYLNLNAACMEIDRVGKTRQQILEEIQGSLKKGYPYGWIQGWTPHGAGNPNWLQYPLLSLDKALPFARPKMPKTLALLRKVKGIKVCSLSRLKPHSFLANHRHPEIYKEGLLQMHIPIYTANEANYTYFNVNGEFRQHKCGEPMIFDGSLDHFALNASSIDRAIVYIEFDKNVLMKKPKTTTRKTTKTRKKLVVKATKKTPKRVASKSATRKTKRA